MLFCISDETIKIYKQETEKEIKKENETMKNKNNKLFSFPPINYKGFFSFYSKDFFLICLMIMIFI